VKRAYELALVEGVTGPVSNRLFRDALGAGKRARTETGISRSQTSVSSVAVELARATLGDLDDRTVLVIGAGGVGQFCVQGARIAGAREIVCVDPLEARLEQAARLGATRTATPEELPETLREVAPDGADTALDLNDPTILDFVELRDARGAVLPPGTQTGAAFGVRRTSLAARLHAIYGNVDDVDAFVGMVSEPHVPGTEMGELQLAMWKRQFTALRDGDRFFYARDPMLRWIRTRFGITYRHTLAQLIALNTDEPLRNLPANVFFAG
jgi:hypothetical protein